MEKTVKVRNIVLGAGIPKICVPVTGRSNVEIIGQMSKICRDCKDIVDIIELRIDFYENVFDSEKLMGLLSEVRQTIGDMALLLTFRSKNEGGEREIDLSSYESLLKNVIESQMADAVDVEAFFDDSLLSSICELAKEKNTVIIASNHDFDKTPKKADIVKRLKAMEDNGADVAKIAVMPNSKADVLTLMSALMEAEELLGIPVIAISMGRLGGISRVAGGVFGSCLTFGTVDKASAPGQMEAGRLKEALELLSI